MTTFIICIDDNNGTLFNHRRQSRDQALFEKIKELCAGTPLTVSPYTAKLLSQMLPDVKLNIIDHPEQSRQEFCFLEDTAAFAIPEACDRIVLFHWNRDYPHDTVFDKEGFLKNGHFFLDETQTFPGKSHDEILMEVFEK